MSAVLIFSPIRLPTPVALSKTSLAGTPPQNSNTAPRPSQTHSEVSPQKHCEAIRWRRGRDDEVVHLADDSQHPELADPEVDPGLSRSPFQVEELVLRALELGFPRPHVLLDDV